jgi:hypothetical protein
VFSFDADDRPKVGDVIWGEMEDGYLVGEVHGVYRTYARGGHEWGYLHVTVECVPYMEE